MPAFVIGSMFTMGLGLNLTQIIAPFKNITLVILSIISNFIIVPLFAYGMTQYIPVSEGVRTGILLLSLGGGAPFIPMVVSVAKGYIGGAVGLMLLLVMVTIIYMPLVIPHLFPGAAVSSWDIAKSLIVTILIPSVLGILIKTRFSEFATRLQPFTAKFTNLMVLLLIIAMLYLYTETIIANLGVLPIVLLFFLGSAVIGYLMGGKNRDARIILAVGTGLRNPPVAMLVATQHFANEPMAAIVPLLIVIVGLSILFPLAAKVGKTVA